MGSSASPRPSHADRTGSVAAEHAIPKSHCLLEEHEVQDFTIWIETQLAALEDRYGDYVTRASVNKSFGR